MRFIAYCSFLEFGLLQMGHQAAQCKTGTIPWREVFGDEAFVVRKPVFWTEVLAKREAKRIDHERLTQDAIAFARAACEAQVRCSMLPEQLTCRDGPFHVSLSASCPVEVKLCFKLHGGRRS
jgi:hypothetical protein